MQPTPSGDPIDPNEPVLELPQTYTPHRLYAPPYFESGRLYRVRAGSVGRAARARRWPPRSWR